MRYTYQFTQIRREENGNLIPVTDKPYEFVFTFGKKIEVFWGESPNNTVLLTKDMWKEYPATNKEILPTVCFSAPSQQGYRRPLVMSKDADKRAGEYRYNEVKGSPIDLKKDQYLSDDIRRLTEIFVTGIRAINEPAKAAPWENLGEANVKHKMSYITSEVYKHLLQDKDNRGKIRSEAFLKKVLEDFFSIIPDSIIEKFDKGLEVHDEIRTKLEGVPKGDDTAIKAVLKSQNYFENIEDFNHFLILYRYILDVKNVFNHLVWVIFRSKIGLITLTNVKKQLSAMFGFVINVQDICEPLEDKDIIKKICGGDRYSTVVEGFLNRLYSLGVRDMILEEQAALCYKFLEECDPSYISRRYRPWDEIKKCHIKILHKEEFKDLCLQYWGIEGKNSYRPCKCKKSLAKFSSDYYKREVWKSMKK